MSKWILNHGCHRGTLTSMDIAQPMPYDTETEAMEAYQEYRKFYASIGYRIWFAELTSPGGETKTLESNPYYG